MDHIDFADCPACNGSGDSPDGTYEGCTTCAGSGRRPATQENLRMAVTAREWADEQVAGFFSEWCELTGTFRAYGVDSWELYGETLRITQDTSCRGCNDTTTHSFPAEMFFADPERRRAMILEQLQEKARTDAAARERCKELEIERLKERLAQLTSPQNP